MTIVETCTGFEAGTFDPFDREHVLAQLGGEYEQRVTSWLFESLCLPPLRRASPPLARTTSWFALLDRSRTRPLHWVHMGGRSTPVNDADRRFGDVLSAKGATVVHAKWDAGWPHELIGRAVDDSDWYDLDSLVGSLSGAERRKRPPFMPKPSDDGWRAESIRLLAHQCTDSELAELSLSRILLNNYLQRWFPGRVADIDLVVLVGENPVIVEIKRKYPAERTYLGLDESEFNIMDWYTNRAHEPYVNLVMVNPVWDKNIFPHHVLGIDSWTGPYVRWLAHWVTRSSKRTTRFTHGRDSGMAGGRRKVIMLGVNDFTTVGAGLEPTLFPHFLCQLILDRADANELYQLSEKATNLYNERFILC